jgi:4-alpha-glucanotransferase
VRLSSFTAATLSFRIFDISLENEKKVVHDFSARSSGILLHLTSLPGKHGSGDLGPEAFKFIEFLRSARQSWWQMLPVGPPGNPPAFSPYDSASSFAGNPWLVSLDRLVSEGLLTPGDIRHEAGFSKSRVNFPFVLPYRETRLVKAYAEFRLGNGRNSMEYIRFCRENAFWLDDYSLYMAIQGESGGKPWTEWASDLRSRNPDALSEARRRLADEINWHTFIQFEFDRQWFALRAKAHQSGIGMIGDLPIFAAHHSADVWSHQELFRLDRKGMPVYISGYPPDRFDKNGQQWGHPQFNWKTHQATGFAWWVSRFERMFVLFDAVRIDHFLGFTRTWSIPYRAAGASKGHWVKSPGEELFTAVRQKLGQRPFIAEDLGHVTDADIRLREMFEMAPMRIFQFGFGTEEDSTIHLPYNFRRLCAAYTGNHDMNTLSGWFRNLTPARRRQVLMYTGGSPDTIHLDSIRALQSSPANVVIFPLQDVLGLGTRARMNVPGTIDKNWIWRLNSKLPDQIAGWLRCQSGLFGRI